MRLLNAKNSRSLHAQYILIVDGSDRPSEDITLAAFCLTLFFWKHGVAHINNKKHLKNVGPICYCEPPHAHSPDVASGAVALRLRIDVHDNDDNDNA